jgi:hypothetical protein
MTLLHSGIDSAVIDLRLGHRSMGSPRIDLHASLEIGRHGLDQTHRPSATLVVIGPMMTRWPSSRASNHAEHGIAAVHGRFMSGTDNGRHGIPMDVSRPEWCRHDQPVPHRTHIPLIHESNHELIELPDGTVFHPAGFGLAQFHRSGRCRFPL